MIHILFTIAVVLVCFVVPTLVRHSHKPYLGLQRFGLGMVCVCVAAAAFASIFETPSYRLPFNEPAMTGIWLVSVASSVVGAAVFAVPLLIIRVVQLHLAAREKSGEGPT